MIFTVSENLNIVALRKKEQSWHLATLETVVSRDDILLIATEKEA